MGKKRKEAVMSKLYPTDDFLNTIYQEKVNNEPLHKATKEQLMDRIEKKKKRLIEILRLEELEHYAENHYVEIKTEQRNGYQLVEYEMTFLHGLTAPLWILKPDTENGRTILYCHGHDPFGGQGSFEDYGQKNPYHKWLPLTMIEHGYTVVIPEFVGFGEVRKEHFKEEEQSWCYANSTALLNLGFNMAGLRVFQVKQLFEQMYERWNMNEVVIYGVSGGGLVDTFYGALESRFKGIIISNYGATFASSTMAMHHCVDNYIPDILSVGECSDIMALAAPVRMLLTNGINDPIFPMEGVKETITQVETVYEKLGCSENFQYEFFEGVHEISPNQIFDFMDLCFANK
jgi:hypothetical protein